MKYIIYFSRLWSQMQRHNAGDPHDPDHQHKVAMNANMSTLEQDIKKQILGRSKAEKVFRPWWDTVEDYLLNCLVLLGKQSLYSLHWGHPYTSDHALRREGLKN